MYFYLSLKIFRIVLYFIFSICSLLVFFFINTFSGHIEVVKLLVAQGAEVTCKDKKSYTPLHAAASSGMISVVKYLLDLGVDVGVLSMMKNGVFCVFVVSLSVEVFSNLKDVFLQ